MSSSSLKLELKSTTTSPNKCLLTGKFFPNKNYAEVYINVDACIGDGVDHELNENTSITETDMVLSYVKALMDTNSLKKVWIRLPLFGRGEGYHPNYHISTVVVKRLFESFFQQEAAQPQVGIEFMANYSQPLVGLGATPEQWEILGQQTNLDSVTDLVFNFPTHSLGPVGINVLNAMSNLVHLDIKLIPFASPTQFLDSLATVHFSGSLKSISVNFLRSPSWLFGFLGNNQQVKHINLGSGALISELTNLICLHHLETLRIGVFVRVLTNARASNFFSPLVSAISKNISPQLKVLDLSFDTDCVTYVDLLHLDSQLQNLTDKLTGAMDQNKSIMRLETFTWTFPRQPDSEAIGRLQAACSMFAAKKKILRATSSGPNILPRAALPAAAIAIKSHPLINQDWGFSSMVFGYLKNNPDIFERALEQQQKKKISGTTEEN